MHLIREPPVTLSQAGYVTPEGTKVVAAPSQLVPLNLLYFIIELSNQNTKVSSVAVSYDETTAELPLVFSDVALLQVVPFQVLLATDPEL